MDSLPEPHAWTSTVFPSCIACVRMCVCVCLLECATMKCVSSASWVRAAQQRCACAGGHDHSFVCSGVFLSLCKWVYTCCVPLFVFLARYD